MRHTPLGAMLTLLAVAAATVAIAGCGGKIDEYADEKRHPGHDA